MQIRYYYIKHIKTYKQLYLYEYYNNKQMSVLSRINNIIGLLL